jgi:hypothetical protein
MSKESQKEFYHQQRLKAEKSGDTKTTTKIYDKLNKAQYGKGMEKSEKSVNQMLNDTELGPRKITTYSSALDNG